MMVHEVRRQGGLPGSVGAAACGVASSMLAAPLSQVSGGVTIPSPQRPGSAGRSWHLSLQPLTPAAAGLGGSHCSNALSTVASPQKCVTFLQAQQKECPGAGCAGE